MTRPAFLRDRVTVAVVGALGIGAVALVSLSLGAPEVPTFVPTAPAPAEVGQTKDGPRVVTVDASSPAEWRFFDFSRGSVVDSPGPEDWDIAFRRFHMMVNGGHDFGGGGGAIDLGEIPFDSVSTVPQAGYLVAERGDSINAALARWYDYSFTSHVLEPKPRVYAVRTADGRYAKMEIVGYYCVGAQPGCPTFRYVYQGEGGTDVAAK
jgi:hypothetical protein